MYYGSAKVMLWWWAITVVDEVHDGGVHAELLVGLEELLLDLPASGANKVHGTSGKGAGKARGRGKGEGGA